MQILKAAKLYHFKRSVFPIKLFLELLFVPIWLMFYFWFGFTHQETFEWYLWGCVIKFLFDLLILFSFSFWEVLVLFSPNWHLFKCSISFFYFWFYFVQQETFEWHLRGFFIEPILLRASKRCSKHFFPHKSVKSLTEHHLSTLASSFVL